jgi:hypothetical protein
VRWARLRFQIIGPLLAAPADAGELKARIDDLAARPWKHPTTGESIRFSFKTIERWLYIARAADDPFAALARKVRGHAGTHPSIPPGLADVLVRQHHDHPRWSFQLHYDNLLALAREDPRLGVIPSYPTLCRFMKGRGLLRARKRRHRETPDTADTEPFTPRERRSYEVTHVHGLWHLDFHQGSRSIFDPSGAKHTPQLLGVLDDRSRLCCHAQWYLDETAEALVHALSQAFQKRGLPRALLTDSVPRNRIGLLCPIAICGQRRRRACSVGGALAMWSHNFVALVQARPDSRVSREGGRRCSISILSVRRPWIASESPGSEVRSKRTSSGSPSAPTARDA